MSSSSIKRYDSGELTRVDIDSPRNQKPRRRWNTWSGSSKDGVGGGSQICCGGLFGTNHRWIGGETWTDVATSYLFPIWTTITWRILSCLYLSLTSLYIIINKTLDTHPFSTNLYLLETLSSLLLLIPYFLHTKPPTTQNTTTPPNLPPTTTTPQTSPLYTLTTLSFQSSTTLTLTHTLLLLTLSKPPSTTIPLLTPILSFFKPLPLIPDLLFSNLPQNPFYHLIPLTFLTIYLLPYLFNAPGKTSPLYGLLYEAKIGGLKGRPGCVVAVVLGMYVGVAGVLWLGFWGRVRWVVERSEAVEYCLKEKREGMVEGGLV